MLSILTAVVEVRLTLSSNLSVVQTNSDDLRIYTTFQVPGTFGATIVH